jgi:outer membrane immunogenic protein
MKTTNLIGAVAVLVLGATGPVFAADMALKAPIMPPPPVYTWTGCYIGGNFGFAKQDTHTVDPNTTPPTDLGYSNAAGLVGGGQVGCDYQMNNLVVGAQGMFDWTDLNQSFPYPPGTAETLGIRTNWFATATGRIGYLPGPNLLVYAKGGAAWKNVSLTDNCPTCGGGEEAYSGNGSATILGWTAGAGFEYLLLPNVSAFAELDFMAFPNTNSTLSYTGPGGGGTYSYNYQHDILAFLVGVNWRFRPY